MVKNSPALQEIQIQSLGWEDALEKGMATHTTILAWRIPSTGIDKAELILLGVGLENKMPCTFDLFLVIKSWVKEKKHLLLPKMPTVSSQGRSVLLNQ